MFKINSKNYLYDSDHLRWLNIQESEAFVFNELAKTRGGRKKLKKLYGERYGRGEPEEQAA